MVVSVNNNVFSVYLQTVLSQNLSFSDIFTITEQQQALLSTFLSNNESSNIPGTITWKEAFRGMNIAIELLQRVCIAFGYPIAL